MPFSDQDFEEFKKQRQSAIGFSDEDFETWKVERFKPPVPPLPKKSWFEKLQGIEEKIPSLSDLGTFAKTGIEKIYKETEEPLKEFREEFKPTPWAERKPGILGGAETVAKNIRAGMGGAVAFPFEAGRRVVFTEEGKLRPPIETAKEVGRLVPQMAEYPRQVFEDYSRFISPLTSLEEKKQALIRIAEDPLGLLFATGLVKGGLKGGAKILGEVQRIRAKPGFQGIALEKPSPLIAGELPPELPAEVKAVVEPPPITKAPPKKLVLGSAELRMKKALEKKGVVEREITKAPELPVREPPPENVYGKEIPQSEIGDLLVKSQRKSLTTGERQQFARWVLQKQWEANQIPDNHPLALNFAQNVVDAIDRFKAKESFPSWKSMGVKNAESYLRDYLNDVKKPKGVTEKPAEIGKGDVVQVSERGVPFKARVTGKTKDGQLILNAKEFMGQTASGRFYRDPSRVTKVLPSYLTDKTVISFKEAEPKPAPAVKEPWEMTQKDYITRKFEIASKLKGASRPRPSILQPEHERLVRQAFERGEKIPLEVLTDYPDLTKQYGKVEAPKATTTTEMHAGVTPADLVRAGEPLPTTERIHYEPPKVKEGGVDVEITRSPEDISWFARHLATLERTSEKFPETKEAYNKITKAENSARYNAIQENVAVDNLINELPSADKNKVSLWGKLRGKPSPVSEKVGNEALSALEGLTDPTSISPSASKIYTFAKDFFEGYRDKIKDELIARGVPAEAVENWGVKDYVRHMLAGQTLVFDSEPKWNYKTGRWETGKIVHVADTIWDANKWAKEQAGNPDFQGKMLYIRPKNTMIPSVDMLRVSPGRYHMLARDIAQEGGWEIKDGYWVLRGKVGQRPAKKFTPITMQRVSPKTVLDDIFVHDPATIMKSYSWVVNRFLEMSKMRREVSPLYEGLLRQGKTNAAGWVEDLRKWTESPYSRAEQDIQKWTEHLPVVGDMVRPFVVRRGIRRALQLQNILKLSNPGFYVANLTQTYVTLNPLNPRIYWDVVKDVITKPSKYNDILAEMKFSPQFGALTEGAKFRLGMLRRIMPGRITEGFDQKVASIFGYRYGREVLNLPHEQALDFGRMMNIRTQFPGSPATTIPWMRGTLRKVFTQYKPFGQKMISNIIYEYNKGIMRGDYKTSARLLKNYLLVSGLKGTAFVLTGATFYKIYNEIKKDFGETTAKAVLVGLPGIVGADVSTRIAPNVLWGQGNVYEKLGRTIVGPTVGTIYDIGKALNTKEIGQLSSISPWARTLLQETQTGKKGEVAISPYTQRGTYKTDKWSKLLQRVGITPVGSTLEYQRKSAMVGFDKKFEDRYGKIMNAFARGERVKALGMVQEWNSQKNLPSAYKVHVAKENIDVRNLAGRWITPDMINEAKKKRGMTSVERYLQGRGKGRAGALQKMFP